MLTELEVAHERFFGTIYFGIVLQLRQYSSIDGNGHCPLWGALIVGRGVDTLFDFIEHFFYRQLTDETSALQALKLKQPVANK